MLDSRFIAVDLPGYCTSIPNRSSIIQVLPVTNIYAFQLTCTKSLRQLYGVYGIRLHHILILCGRDIRRIDHNAVNAIFGQCIICSISREPRFVYSMILPIRVMSVQKIKELFCGRFLGVRLWNPYFQQYCNGPRGLVNVDTYKYLLSFKTYLLSLHCVCVLWFDFIFFCFTKIVSNRDTLSRL